MWEAEGEGMERGVWRAGCGMMGWEAEDLLAKRGAQAMEGLGGEGGGNRRGGSLEAYR